MSDHEVSVMEKFMSQPQPLEKEGVSVEFTCKCGKQKGWIFDGEIKKIPCPKCGRRYQGKYDRKTFTIKAIEIKTKRLLNFIGERYELK